jgi:hypothetical protein
MKGTPSHLVGRKRKDGSKAGRKIKEGRRWRQEGR